jgi:hypothetical protein
MKNGPSARSRTRPNRGPRPGKRFPTWATPAGPLVVSRPSSSNGHARNPVEQNRHRRPHSLCARRGNEPDAPLEPLADVRAHHCVDAPPSSGLTMASLRACVHRQGGECCQPWRFGPQAHTGERWSGCSTSTVAPTFLAAVTRARAHRRRLGLFPHDGGGYTVGRNEVRSTKL